MQKLWITTIILLICCSNQSNNTQHSDSDYKKNKKKLQSDLFKKKKESIAENKSGNINHIQEPIPSFKSQHISNHKESNENSSGFFSFFSKGSKEKIDKNRQAVCDELLDINKIVVIDQNEKLIEISIQKDNLRQHIKSLEADIKNRNSKEKKQIQELEAEINRLNWLVTVLSSEIK